MPVQVAFVTGWILALVVGAIAALGGALSGGWREALRGALAGFSLVLAPVLLACGLGALIWFR
ncbi:MAG: hypothetical protein AB1758_15260 [Candidatus Eremiobacterota bacterium]